MSGGCSEYGCGDWELLRVGVAMSVNCSELAPRRVGVAVEESCSERESPLAGASMSGRRGLWEFLCVVFVMGRSHGVRKLRCVMYGSQVVSDL